MVCVRPRGPHAAQRPRALAIRIFWTSLVPSGYQAWQELGRQVFGQGVGPADIGADDV